MSTATAPAEDPKHLFERLRRDGESRARDELVSRFLPLARRLAARYRGAGEPFDDLMQVASLGLVKAVDRFDHRRGVAFTTYAVPTISGELKRHFRDNSWAVHVPRGMRDRALKLHATIKQLSEDTGERPASEELAERLSLSQQQVDDALGALGAFDAVSLDAPAYHGSEPDVQSRGETVGTVDGDYELAEDRATLQKAMKQIPSRDRRVLQMRFVEDRTQSDIAADIGVSQMQVSRILRRALERLRHAIDGPEHQRSRRRRASALVVAQARQSLLKQAYTSLRLFRLRISAWTLLAGVFSVVAVWEVVQTSVFEPDVARWLTFSNGLVVAVLAGAGLVANELSSERVVHVLEVIDHSDQAMS